MPEVQWELAGHESRSAHDVYLAMQGRTFWSRAFDALFDEFDFVVLPGAQVFPFDKTVHWPTHVAGVEMENHQQWMTISGLLTLTGCPVIGVPAGLGDTGLPMGIQIVGRRGRDLAVLRFAHAYEHARGF